MFVCVCVLHWKVFTLMEAHSAHQANTLPSPPPQHTHTHTYLHSLSTIRGAGIFLLLSAPNRTVVNNERNTGWRSLLYPAVCVCRRREPFACVKKKKNKKRKTGHRTDCQWKTSKFRVKSVEKVLTCDRFVWSVWISYQIVCKWGSVFTDKCVVRFLRSNQYGRAVVIQQLTFGITDGGFSSRIHHKKKKKLTLGKSQRSTRPAIICADGAALLRYVNAISHPPRTYEK